MEGQRPQVSAGLELEKNYKDCVVASLDFSRRHQLASSSSSSPESLLAENKQQPNTGWRPPTRGQLVLNKVRLASSAADCLQQASPAQASENNESDSDPSGKLICANQQLQAAELRHAEQAHATGVLICSAAAQQQQASAPSARLR